MSETEPTVRSIVESLGGREAVGDACAVGYTAVSNWISWNRFPDRVHRPLSRLCEGTAIKLPDSLFDKEHAAGDAGTAA